MITLHFSVKSNHSQRVDSRRMQGNDAERQQDARSVPQHCGTGGLHGMIEGQDRTDIPERPAEHIHIHPDTADQRGTVMRTEVTGGAALSFKKAAEEHAEAHE